MTNGLTMFYRVIEPVSLIVDEMGRGISFWAENHKQNLAQAIDIGGPITCTSLLGRRKPRREIVELDEEI